MKIHVVWSHALPVPTTRNPPCAGEPPDSVSASAAKQGFSGGLGQRPNKLWTRRRDGCERSDAQQVTVTSTAAVLTPPPAQRSAQPPAANSLDTPSYAQYSSTSGPYQQAAYVQAASELENKFISTSAAHFIEFCFPTDPDTGSPPQVDYDALSRISQYKNEIKMYDPLIAALEPAVAANWSFVNTSAHLDPESKFLLNAPLFIELKTDPADDPFEDTDNGIVPRPSARGRDTRGQVITYLNANQASQRVHTFGVLIIANHCRLFRLTRSAMEVTQRFNYTALPLLVRFLWFSHASPDVRGLDTTFEKITVGGQRDSRRARELINGIGKPLWSVTISAHSFYVSHPFTCSHHRPLGHGTRESKTDRVCLLKDTWRVVGYHTEGQVYTRLKEQQVQNVPNVIIAKDVVGPHHRCGVDDYPGFLWSKSRLKEQAIREHQHYRVVLDVVGRPLVEFGSTYELVKCMLDALQVDNLKRTRTLGPKPASSTETFRDGGARAYERVGTRQFMSARLSASSATEPQAHARELADDLESFLLVLLWVAIAYAPGTMTASARAHELQVFDDANAAAKRRLLSSGRSSAAYFNLSSPHFECLLGTLLDGFARRYSVRLRLDPGPPVSTVHLESHGWMVGVMRRALEDETWRALKDAGEAQPVERPEGMGRKSEISEY
ncbi:hypothetical protein B0H13DRAFT_2679256 [Mycena leptocephala]|nr:hypothetical protein B0H13DRAFT_2679256 [Mycena leptocephala]